MVEGHGRRDLLLLFLMVQLLKQLVTHKTHQGVDAAEEDYQDQKQSDDTAVAFGRLRIAGAEYPVIPGIFIFVFIPIVHRGIL